MHAHVVTPTRARIPQTCLTLCVCVYLGVFQSLRWLSLRESDFDIDSHLHAFAPDASPAKHSPSRLVSPLTSCASLRAPGDCLSELEPLQASGLVSLPPWGAHVRWKERGLQSRSVWVRIPALTLPSRRQVTAAPRASVFPPRRWENRTNLMGILFCIVFKD